MILERVTPESVGIHSEGILKFIDLAESRGLELHSMMLLRHGKVCAEGWWKPYNPASPHMMFSFYKGADLHGHRLCVPGGSAVS